MALSQHTPRGPGCQSSPALATALCSGVIYEPGEVKHRLLPGLEDVTRGAAPSYPPEEAKRQTAELGDA